MKSLKDFNFKDKKVLLRVDFNVPVGKDRKVDSKEDWRIESTLPTINHLLDQGAKVIILAHLGRPDGEVKSDLRLDPVAKRLEELLNKKVIKLDESCGEKVDKEISKMKPGDVIMLENLRFHSEEKANDNDFAKKLASYGEIYVNDAFGVNHRAHASLVGIPKYLPSCAGLLLEKEMEILSKVMEKPDRPLAVIIGGVKISTKIKFIKNFLNKADNLLLGGALANTVIAAKGFAIGRSVNEAEMVDEVKKMELTNTKLHLPVDTVASVEPSGRASSRIAPVGNTEENEMILDIGPDTIELFRDIVEQAETIIWNGPMGLMEIEEFVQGSKEIAKIVAQSKGFSIVGGGDSITLLEKMDLLGKINHVSTGGGAMLKFLAGEELPAVKALEG